MSGIQGKFGKTCHNLTFRVRELRKNKVPVRKAVFINSAKLDWYIIKPQVPYVAQR